MKKITILGIVLAVIIAGVLIFPPLRNKEAEKNPASRPSAPAMVTASPGVRQITLTWQPVAEAAAYNIYWATQSPVTQADKNKITCTDARYIHTGLAGDTTYYYIVTAVNAHGESPASREVSAMAWPPYTVPENAQSAAEAEFERQLMERLMNSEQPSVEPPDTEEPTWDPNAETPPPREEWPDEGRPTWDPNKEAPPPRSEWPGEGETQKWSPHDEPQKFPTPF
ncbi:fibronectin type III domain-containing protein [Desulfosudis oleivorans]|uniref:Fibronectin type III domain protein n=1 Tax=Desulfosudis oleivorans (strain DSM 6200 / JCM 39069 / Hxd3) TaxID=96561 RepID=A9A0X2_DESOH|nr:fibronectin type III domain-containing protein [Desulfosudis oleivorans]ABW67597.1 Fibronectin type III domain protein [Desulfosudis oleivorans Hxd3]